MPLKYVKKIELGVKDGFIQNLPNLKKLWKEREVLITNSSTLIEEFVPPENRGQAITEVKTHLTTDIIMNSQISIETDIPFDIGSEKQMENYGELWKRQTSCKKN